MTSPAESLARLARIGSLKEEPRDQRELEGLLRSGRVRLEDARRAEYEGIIDIDDQLVEDLIAAAEAVSVRIDELELVPPEE